MVSFGMLVIGWAMSFPFASLGSQVANQIALLLGSQVVGPLGLGAFALLICGVVAVFHLFRNRVGRAVTEIALSMAALIFASFILANPGAIVRNGFRIESQIIGTILSLGADTHAQAPTGNSASSTLDSLKALIVQADVSKPYDLIDWGAVLTGRCAAIRDEALNLGPWQDASAPRDTMRKAPECVRAADFNQTATPSRAFASAMNTGNAFISLGLLAVLALALLAAQIAAVGIMAISPLAIIAALFPGVMRSAFWRWWEAAKRSILVTLVAAAVLGFWAILMRAVMDKMAGQPLVYIFLAMLAMTITSVVIAIAGFRRVPQIARNMTKTLERKEGWVPSRKSHGGAFGLGLGVVGLGEAAALKSKVASLMPAGHQSRKIVKAVHSLSDEHRQLNEGWEPEGPYTGPDAPKGPGALSTTVYNPYGDGKWRPDAEHHVKAERVPPRTDNWTTPTVMEEAQNRLANPLRRPTITLPVQNPRKVERLALPVGGSTTDAPG
jgi:hypothetical protein